MTEKVKRPRRTFTLDKWIKQSQTTGSFKEKDNRTPEEQELIELGKQNHS